MHVHPPRAQAARRRQLNKHSATKDSQKRNRPTAETGSLDTWCAVSWGFPRQRTGVLASHTRAPHAMSYRRPGIIHLEALTFRVESDGQILQYLKGSTCGLLRCEGSNLGLLALQADTLPSTPPGKPYHLKQARPKKGFQMTQEFISHDKVLSHPLCCLFSPFTREPSGTCP